MLRRLPLLAVLCALAWLAGAGTASAHTELRAITPAAGATVPGVTEVRLEFTDAVHPRLSTVRIVGPEGVDATSGPARGDGSTVVQPVRGELAAGEWTVSYRVVAADGHPVTGTSRFLVEPPAAVDAPAPVAPAPVASESVAPEPAAPAPADSAESDGSPVPALLLGGGALVVGAAVARVMAARRRSGRDSVPSGA